MAKAKAPPPASADPAATANHLLDQVTKELLPKVMGGAFYGKKIESVPAGKAILTQDRTTQAALVKAALDRLEGLEAKIAAFRAKYEARDVYNLHHQPGWWGIWTPRWMLDEMLRGLLRRARAGDSSKLVV